MLVITSSHDNVTEKNALKGMFGRKEILELEAVDVDGLDEKTKEATFKEVLDELRKRLGLGVTKNPELFKDHKIHQLKKYYYESTPKSRKRRLIRRAPRCRLWQPASTLALPTRCSLMFQLQAVRSRLKTPAICS